MKATKLTFFFYKTGFRLIDETDWKMGKYNNILFKAKS